ncbi:MAG: FAD-binding oxidoreductase [Caulobacteraceae bacterium]|jgi:decaprenylphospho-beta-D-ribofuranose 2-oxidase|nr:FAD-binding oxidoreductase [Caulobacteraceae bacterium]
MSDTSIVDNGKHYVARGITLVAPADEAEVRAALMLARRAGRPVIARGAGKSQGGLYQADGAVILDMSKFNRIVDIDADQRWARVQAGVIWDRLRLELEGHGLAVASSQSYGVFSVGGSISINAHGRNIDVGVVARSILSIRVMLADGSVVEADRQTNAELFSLVLGGLGLFGIVLEATLVLVANTIYRCRGVSIMQCTEYPGHVARSVLTDPSVHFHYARFDIADGRLWERLYTIEYFQDAELAADALPVLTGPPRSAWFEHCVGWLIRRAAWARRIRLVGEAVYRLDMKPRRRSATVREAWSVVDHTRRPTADWLQEYFIPRDRFMDFVTLAQPILNEGSIRILNTTVRIIHKNTDAFLTYARQDSFAFVIFFQQTLDQASIRRTEDVLRRLLDCALACGGAYYLCYQRVAEPAQLAQAYPKIGAFFAAKRRYDPDGLLINEFYKQYAPAFPLETETAA